MIYLGHQDNRYYIGDGWSWILQERNLYRNLYKSIVPFEKTVSWKKEGRDGFVRSNNLKRNETLWKEGRIAISVVQLAKSNKYF